MNGLDANPESRATRDEGAMKELPWTLVGVGIANLSAVGLLVWLHHTHASTDLFVSTADVLNLGNTVLFALGEQKRRPDALERRLSREPAPDGTTHG